MHINYFNIFSLLKKINQYILLDLTLLLDKANLFSSDLINSCKKIVPFFVSEANFAGSESCILFLKQYLLQLLSDLFYF